MYICSRILGRYDKIRVRVLKDKSSLQKQIYLGIPDAIHCISKIYFKSKKDLNPNLNEKVEK